MRWTLPVLAALALIACAAGSPAPDHTPASPTRIAVIEGFDDLLKRPNGIAWDTAGNQLLFAPLEGIWQLP